MIKTSLVRTLIFCFRRQNWDEFVNPLNDSGDGRIENVVLSVRAVTSHETDISEKVRKLIYELFILVFWQKKIIIFVFQFKSNINSTKL